MANKKMEFLKFLGAAEVDGLSADEAFDEFVSLNSLSTLDTAALASELHCMEIL